jgi:ABC-2 type transport system permease protein
MFYLLRKEIGSFFNSLIGYVVISVFLLITALFLWVFPGEFNIPESGYASLDPLFTLAPWVFLFLMPAITMRLFADEKKTGTIELLFTKPFSDFQIIFAKYLSGFLIGLFSLLPSLIFYFSVYLLGSEIGNLDVGGTFGSYIGLLFLMAIYVAIGLFASALTEIQIIAFLLAVFMSFFLYIGFELISSMKFLSSISEFILNLGINEHYKSISRGVIDIRDIIYFISVIALFLFSTKTVLESRKW